MLKLCYVSAKEKLQEKDKGAGGKRERHPVIIFVPLNNVKYPLGRREILLHWAEH